MKFRYILLPLCALALAACEARPAVQPVTLVPASTTITSFPTFDMSTTTETTAVTTTTTEQPAPPIPAQTTEQQSVVTEEARPHGRRGEFCSPHGAVSIEGYTCTYKGKAWRWE